MSNLKYIEDLNLISCESFIAPVSWIVTKDNLILIIVCYSNSQALLGSGAAGEAVDKIGRNEMDP